MLSGPLRMALLGILKIIYRRIGQMNEKEVEHIRKIGYWALIAVFAIGIILGGVIL